MTVGICIWWVRALAFSACQYECLSDLLQGIGSLNIHEQLSSLLCRGSSIKLEMMAAIPHTRSMWWYGLVYISGSLPCIVWSSHILLFSQLQAQNVMQNKHVNKTWKILSYTIPSYYWCWLNKKKYTLCTTKSKKNNKNICTNDITSCVSKARN